MTRKRQILNCLTKSFLNDIAREHGVIGAFHMYKEDLVATLSGMKSVKIRDIISDMFLQDLKLLKKLAKTETVI